MNAPQGTEAWLIERAGSATASRFCDVLAKVKAGESASRRKYRLQLVTERLTGLPTPSYSNAAMEWGKQQEPFARMAYEAHSGLLAVEVPFRKHPTLAWCGSSPDGVIEDDGGLEIKCPDSITHVGYLTAGVAPSEYLPQIQGNMWVTGRAWWDFVSFDPRLPPNLRLFVVRVPRDDAYIETLAREVEAFLGEVARDEDALRRRA